MITKLSLHTAVVCDGVVDVRLHLVDREDLVRGQGRRPRLRRYHPPEPGHVPRPHVVVLGTHGDQQLLREGHLEVNVFSYFSLLITHI